MPRVQLEPRYVIETLQRLESRVRERFPEAKLVRTAHAVLETAKQGEARTREFMRPITWLRILIGALVVLLPAAIVYELTILDLSFAPQGLGEVVAFFQSAVESLVFIGLGVIFLWSIETRIKRRRALAAVHELRELAHIIDMHQLDKDPSYLIDPGLRTASSPSFTLSAFELNRYLDYCSELLALIGKIAALYGQRMADPVALEAVDQVENLSTGISRKIWQKLMVLEQETSRIQDL